MYQLIRKLDHALLVAEKAVCVCLIGLMSFAVFFDVVHRLSGTVGPLDRLFASLMAPQEASWASRGCTALMAAALVYAALRTARTKQKPEPLKAVGIAGGVTVAVGLGIWGMHRVLPNGFVGSQTFALCGMLWVGFLGASIATHEGSHLTLEITEFLWRGEAKAWVGRIGSLAAAGFCAVLGWLCWVYVRYQYDEWVSSEGLSGVFDGFPAPKFAVYAILPWVLATMTLRFLARVLFPHEPSGPAIKPVTEPGGRNAMEAG